MTRKTQQENKHGIGMKSRVKGHHIYDHNYKVNEKLESFLEPENEYSKNAIIVKSKDIVERHLIYGPTFALRFWWAYIRGGGLIFGVLRYFESN